MSAPRGRHPRILGAYGPLLLTTHITYVQHEIDRQTESESERERGREGERESGACTVGKTKQLYIGIPPWTSSTSYVTRAMFFFRFYGFLSLSTAFGGCRLRLRWLLDKDYFRVVIFHSREIVSGRLLSAASENLHL